jgi:hypothetical protein
MDGAAKLVAVPRQEELRQGLIFMDVVIDLGAHEDADVAQDGRDKAGAGTLLAGDDEGPASTVCPAIGKAGDDEALVEHPAGRIARTAHVGFRSSSCLGAAYRLIGANGAGVIRLFLWPIR